MKRLVFGLLALTMSMAPTAFAGNVCINGGNCQPVPMLHGNVVVGLDTITVSIGVDDVTTVGPTGFSILGAPGVQVYANGGVVTKVQFTSIAADDVRFYVCLLGGCSQPIGVTIDFFTPEVRLYPGTGGCVKIGLSPGLC